MGNEVYMNVHAYIGTTIGLLQFIKPEMYNDDIRYKQFAPDDRLLTAS